jgi:hypothetical protein
MPSSTRARRAHARISLKATRGASNQASVGGPRD